MSDVRRVGTRKARILTYHRVGVPRRGRYERQTVRPDRFKSQIAWLRRLRFSFTDLDVIDAWLTNGTAVARHTVVLTFDDGYGDLYEHAFSILSENRIPAVVYLVSGLKEDGWRRAESPDPLRLLNLSEIKEMSKAGIVFGSHTRTHARLTECSPHELKEEVLGSKKSLEDRMGQEVRHFCYPYGAYNDRVVDAVGEAGYATACTAERGSVQGGADPLRLPRLTVGKRMGRARFLLRLTIRS